MDIKKFTVGQTAHIMGDGRSRKTHLETVEAEVIKVGRIYVTVKTPGGWPMKFGDLGNHEPYLVEKTDIGAPRMLFPSAEAVTEYREKQHLEAELRTAFDWNHIGRIQLEKLRAVKRILEGEE